MAAAVAFAVIGADGFAAAAETFAIILSAAGVFLRSSAGSLAPAVILAFLALAFAIVQAATEMHVGISQRYIHSAFPYGRRFVGFSAAEQRASGETSEGSSGELVKFAAVHWQGLG